LFFCSRTDERDILSNLVVFDLDGVITSEEAYLVTAGLVLHEMLYSPRYWNVEGAQTYMPPDNADACVRLSHEVLPTSVMLGFKARSINSNWDTCYAAVCVCLVDLLTTIPDYSALLPLQPWDALWLKTFREMLMRFSAKAARKHEPYRLLQEPLFLDYVGLELFERLTTYTRELVGQSIDGVFARYSPFWLFCQNMFQETYLGDTLYTQEHRHAPAQAGKYGCIHMEQALLPVEKLSSTLQTLRDQDYTLGIATGRPGPEAIVPLQNYGLFEYFDPEHVMTHSEVAVAEEKLQSQDKPRSLVKPHPYQFLAAAYPGADPDQSPPARGSFVVVGDTTSDVLGGRAAGALVIAVLTGARTAEARHLLEKSQPDFMVPDVTYVPDLLQRLDDLATIQQMQFVEREKAEILLRRWFLRALDLQVDEVRLMPKAVSLNSFNGIYRVGTQEYFFKTHVEEQGILEEYYHAELLQQAGYNIVRPIRTVHQKGQQMVIYPVIQSPVMFDLMRAVEMGDTSQATVALLVAAERRECERLLTIYRETLAVRSPEEHAQAPIHQLFWHRLTGGRLQSFYEHKLFPFPNQSADTSDVQGISFEEMLNYQWTINGEEISHPESGLGQSLGQLIARAKEVLQPAQAALTVIGHGDAHFGNVFLEEQAVYQYFDPAFAGRHTPLLDIVKPLFHNVFATWMYFPHDVEQQLKISVAIQGSRIVVEHNYELTRVRQAMLETKLTYLLPPLLSLLRERQALPQNWAEIVRLALLCCPLLTVNLLDDTKRSAAICWLGLSQAMQMGNLSSIGGVEA
jgi:phosphoglycolate phosphatase-like HAD superfamily hydrolase